MATYSTTSEIAKKVCEAINFRFGIQFVSVLNSGRKDKDGTPIYHVKGTCGHPEDFTRLYYAVRNLVNPDFILAYENQKSKKA